MPFGYISGFLWFCSEQRLALYYVRHPCGANVVPDWGNFRDIFGPSLLEREIHTYIYRYKSVLMGDSGPSGWDWAGGRLKLTYILGRCQSNFIDTSRTSTITNPAEMAAITSETFR